MGLCMFGNVDGQAWLRVMALLAGAVECVLAGAVGCKRRRSAIHQLLRHRSHHYTSPYILTSAVEYHRLLPAMATRRFLFLVKGYPTISIPGKGLSDDFYSW